MSNNDEDLSEAGPPSGAFDVEKVVEARRAGSDYILSNTSTKSDKQSSAEPDPTDKQPAVKRTLPNGLFSNNNTLDNDDKVTKKAHNAAAVGANMNQINQDAMLSPEEPDLEAMEATPEPVGKLQRSDRLPEPAAPPGAYAVPGIGREEDRDRPPEDDENADVGNRDIEGGGTEQDMDDCYSETVATDLALSGASVQHSTGTGSGNMQNDGDDALIEAELVADREESVIVDAVQAPSRKFYVSVGIAVIVVLAVIASLVAVLPDYGSSSQTTTIIQVQNDDDDNKTFTESTIIGQTIIGSAAGDRFGAPLAIATDGTILAVGARNNGDAGADSGIVRVYQLDPENKNLWRPFGDTMRGLESGDQFAFSGLAISGNGRRVAAAAPYHNVSDDRPSAGHVRVFDMDANSRKWKQVGPSIDGLAADDLFGRAVSMSADGKIVAGASYQSSENGQYSAHVRIFEQTTVNGTISWEQMGSTLLGKAAYDRLGRALAMSEDGLTIAAGATQFKGVGPGYVQVFRYNGTDWDQVGVDVVGSEDQDVFGRDVSLSRDGKILASGANLGDDNGKSAGYMYVYELKTSANGVEEWQQLGNKILGDAKDDGLGLTVTLSASGTRVGVGASQKKGGVGYARIYDIDRVANQWIQVGEDLLGSNDLDKFGTTVRLSADGTIVAVGAIGSDANGDDSGQVQIFNLTGV